MINASQFQERLIEYLDGELPEAERREVEEYLRAHPETAGLKGDLALLSAAGRSIRESSYPADLLLEANRALAARLGGRSDGVGSVREAAPLLSGNGSPQTPGPTPAPRNRRRWRPRALAAALAAAAILLAGAASQRAAIAEVAGSLLERIRVSVTVDGRPVEIREAVEIEDGVILVVADDGADDGVRKFHEQQQQLQELVQVTETLDESGDRVVTVDVNQDRAPLGLPDGVLEIEIGEPDSLEGGEMIRVRSGSGPFPAAKAGAALPGASGQSWGEVKETVDPKVEASP